MTSVRPIFLLVLGLCTAALSILAQSGTSAQRSPYTNQQVSLIAAIVCIALRKQEIGGWLAYFLSQIFLSGFFALVVVLMYPTNYFPAASDDSVLYWLFLLSNLPGLVIVVCLMAAVVALVKTRSWMWVGRMRAIFIAYIVAGLVGLAIDLLFFTDNVVLAVFGLVPPSIWWSYFSCSKRVRRVFLTKDWGDWGPLIAAPSFLDKQPKKGVIYTESELEAMKANEGGHERTE